MKMSKSQFATYQAMRCKKKKPLKTRRAAKLHGRNKGCYPYKCPICRQWHVSSHPPKGEVWRQYEGNRKGSQPHRSGPGEYSGVPEGAS